MASPTLTTPNTLTTPDTVIAPNTVTIPNALTTPDTVMAPNTVTTPNSLTTPDTVVTPNTVTTPTKRILPGTPIAVAVPDEGHASLFYDGQVFTPGQERPSDGLYLSTYADETWRGGLHAPPIYTSAPNRVAAIGWSKVEIRLYFIDGDNILKEYYYSGNKGDDWVPGSLQKNLTLRAIPSSSVAAVHWYDGERGSCIRVFYQGYQEDSGSGLQAPINEVRWTNSKKWHVGPTLAYALPGCGLAAVTYRLNNQQQIHIFYQSLELSLSELYYYEVHDEWLPGEKNLGIAGDTTPITAFGWSSGDDEELQVYWRNKTDNAEIVGAKKSRKQPDIPRWTPIDPVVGGLSFDDQFAVAQWGNSKHMRLYYASSTTSSIIELCQDYGAGWIVSDVFSGQK